MSEYLCCGVEHLLDANAVLAVNPALELSVAILELNANSIVEDATRLAALDKLGLWDLSQTPEAGSIDLLATSNLVLGTTECFKCMLAHVLAAADGAQNLANVDTGDSTVRLTEGTSHPSLETISAGAGKHLVDTNDVERVHTDADVESILTRTLGHVLVACNTACLEGLRTDLLELIRHQMGTEGEVVDGSLFATQIIDTDLGIWHTTAVARLDVRLVLLIAIALGWAVKSNSHWACLSHLHVFLGGYA